MVSMVRQSTGVGRLYAGTDETAAAGLRQSVWRWIELSRACGNRLARMAGTHPLRQQGGKVGQEALSHDRPETVFGPLCVDPQPRECHHGVAPLRPSHEPAQRSVAIVVTLRIRHPATAGLAADRPAADDEIG